MAAAGGDGEVGDEGVLGLAGAVRHVGAVAVPLRQAHGVQGLGHRPDLVRLDEDRVGGADVDAALQEDRVRAEQVVADQLDLRSEGRRDPRPAVPVVLGQRVLDEDDRVAVDPFAPERDHLRRAARRPVRLERDVGTVAPHLARRRIETDCDVGPGTVAGLPDRLDDQLDRFLVARQIRGEAAFVADAGRPAPAREQRPQGMEGLDAHAERLGERRRVVRGDLELLEVDRVVRVPPAVDDVEAGHRQQRRVAAAEMPVQRDAGRRGRRPRRRHRHAENRVGAEPGLVRGAVEFDQPPVEPALVRRVVPGERPADLAVDVGHRLPDALAAVARAAVPQLRRLALAGRCAGRHARGRDGAVVEVDAGLHRRIAPRIDHFQPVDRPNLHRAARLRRLMRVPAPGRRSG